MDDPKHPSANELYEALKHGDDLHRQWLREAIDAVFAGKPVPLPYSKSDKKRVMLV